MESFKIRATDAQLDDLKRRLDATRWPDLPFSYGWEAGADPAYVRALCDYWREEYDWRSREAVFNRWPQFLTEIDGLSLHFYHIRSGRSGCQPLLLLHGWPGSVAEFLELIPMLDHYNQNGDSPGFDLVIPSLPGFGFSSKPTEAGYSPSRIAAILHSLMVDKLGYERYAIQGGDWGTIIGARIAGLFGSHVNKLHINMPFAPPPSGADVPQEWAQRQEKHLPYRVLMHTIPDSLATSFSDSPAGLATWLLEKFHAWSSPPGLESDLFSLDRLIDNLMLYWLTNSAGSAARIYHETKRANDPTFGAPPVSVPTAVAAFPYDPFQSPRAWVEQIYNVERWTDMPTGGHFAAMEAPRLLFDDMIAFLAPKQQD